MMRAFSRGEAGAAEELYDRYAPRIYGLGMVMLGNDASAQDLVQDTFVKLLRNADRYDPARGKYGAAIFNILRLSALATMLVLGGFMFIMFRRDAAHRLKATGKDCAESGVDAT